MKYSTSPRHHLLYSSESVVPIASGRSIREDRRGNYSLQQASCISCSVIENQRHRHYHLRKKMRVSRWTLMQTFIAFCLVVFGVFKVATATTSEPPSTTPSFIPIPNASNHTIASPSPAGGHDVVLVLFHDDNCTSMSNPSDVAVNPFQAGNGTCKQWPYSATGATTFVTLTCGLSGVEVAMFDDSGCHQLMQRSMMPKDSCVRMPSAFGMNASNSFGIMCGHFGTAPAVPIPPHGQHNVSVALYADQGCTSPSNASVVAVNPYVARSDSCVQNPYSSTDFPTYIKFACGLSGVGVQVFLDSGCMAAVSNGTLLPSDSCVTMPSEFCTRTLTWSPWSV